MNIEVDEVGLPLAKTKQVVTMDSLRVLMVAPPGFGKTTLLTAAPDCILLACEEGHRFIECHKLIIDSWDDSKEHVDQDGNLHVSFLEAVARLVASDRFRFVVVDTLDALVKMCTDHFLKKYRGEHISDLGDYGKGYDIAQNAPIRRIMGELLKTGRGVSYVTHQEITQKTFTAKGKKAETKTKKETSLPNGIVKFVLPQMDIVYHGEFGGTREGNSYRDRIIRTEGGEDILAKNRGGVMPRAWIVPRDPQEAWKQLERFLVDREAVIAAEREYHEWYGGFDDLDFDTDEEEVTVDSTEETVEEPKKVTVTVADSTPEPEPEPETPKANTIPKWGKRKK